jgi:hypothetical protein
MSATIVELKANGGNAVEVSSDQEISKEILSATDDSSNVAKQDALVADSEVKAGPPAYDGDDDDPEDDTIIITGADAANHLLPLRDDFERSLTFRSLVLATILSGFQAVMTQIYNVSCRNISTIYGPFLRNWNIA